MEAEELLLISQLIHAPIFPLVDIFLRVQLLMSVHI